MQDIRSTLKTLKREFPNMMDSLTHEMGSRFKSKAALLTPVDTGQLQRSWEMSPVQQVSPGHFTVTISNEQPYAEEIDIQGRSKQGKHMRLQAGAYIQDVQQSAWDAIVLKTLGH